MADALAVTISDLASPGDLLSEALDERGMSAADLARRTGRSEKHISELLHAKTTLSLNVALELEQVLGIPARLWQSLEFNYRSELRRREILERKKTFADWMRRFPIREMMRAGYLPQVGRAPLPRIEAVLDFFGVTSPDTWQAEWDAVAARFRQSHAYAPDFFALTAWLRRGELDAQGIHCPAYCRETFAASMSDARALTTQKPDLFHRRLREICSAAGVAFTVTPSLPKLAISGATRWVGGKAILQLSLRHKTDDQFWFSFFHEAYHVLEHRSNTIYLDMSDGETDSREERLADAYARDLLIPPESYAEFVGARNFKDVSIRRFAAAVGVAPGIIVGRLQHEKQLPFSQGNSLKQRFRWAFEARDPSGKG